MINSVQPIVSTNFKKNNVYNDNAQPKEKLFSKTEYTPHGNPYKSSSLCGIVFPIVSLALDTTKFIINKEAFIESYQKLSALADKNFSRGKFIAMSSISLVLNAIIACMLGTACDKFGNYKRANNADISALNEAEKYNMNQD